MQQSQMVLIADQDDEARTRHASALRRAGFDVKETAGGDEALEIAKRYALAAVVLEVSLTGLSGYEVCRAIRSEVDPDLPILFASGMRTESFDRVAGLLLGADDYLVKPVATDELLTRIRALVRRTAISAGAPPGRSLTPRELQILGLVAEGLRQQEIADRLYISSKTVSTHIEHILRKLGVRSRAQAVAVAFRDRLLDKPAPLRAARRRLGARS
jgi:DNA-binding NarL/FixJ family response regulator